MDTFKGVLLVLVLILGVGAFFLFLKSSTARAEVRDARVLSSSVLDLLRAQGARCDARADQFGRIAEDCVRPLLAIRDFREDSFRQPRQDAPGYLVIKNTQAQVYESSEFRFYFNRRLMQEGCTVEGDIDTGVTCRFEFTARCEEGYVLEVFYPIDGEDRKVFLKTC